MRQVRPGLDLVGATALTLRMSIGWSQRELGHRVGLSQSEISRMERGLLADLTIQTAERVLGAMGARLVISIDAPFLGDRESQRDPAHARCSSHVAARLRRAGWLLATEVEVGGDRSRGWIDVLAMHRATGLLLIIEIKTEIRDLGGIERTLGWYEREAWTAARRLGWRPTRSIGCLLLLATEANEARVLENRVAFGTGFPVRARDLNVCLADGSSPQQGGRAVAMIDPLSRRTSWIRALRLDGRRSPAPFRDYADFMSVVRRGGRPARDGRPRDAAHPSDSPRPSVPVGRSGQKSAMAERGDSLADG